MNEDDQLPAERPQPVTAAKDLAADIAGLIQDARQAVACAVNSGLTLLYWRIGQRIQGELLKGERADYGQQILATVAQQLTRDFGRGFSYSALTRMVKLYEVYPEQAIVATLSQVLSWSHFRELLPLEQPLQRDFYAELCRVERWSVRTLREKIGSMLYERTSLSKKPAHLAWVELEALRETDRLSPDLVFRDPYLLDFLGLKDRNRLYWEDFKRIPTCYPPPEEQAAIVRYLDHVDRRVRRLVRAKRKLIALLTEQKQAVIYRAISRGLDPDVPLKESGVGWLGEVPAHWDVMLLGRALIGIGQGWSPVAAEGDISPEQWAVLTLRAGCTWFEWDNAEDQSTAHSRLASNETAT